MMDRLQAVDLIAAGAHIFPCNSEKIPIGKWRDRGWSDPDKLIAVGNGLAGIVPSSVGCMVIDVDKEVVEGGLARLFKMLEAHDIAFVFHLSGSRKAGRGHIWVRTDDKLGNGDGWRNEYAAGDIRSDSGYVVAWQPDAIFEAMELPVCRAADVMRLIDTVERPREGKGNGGGGGGGLKHGGYQVGSRNNSLFLDCIRAIKWKLPTDEYEEMARQAGLPEWEIQGVVNSARKTAAKRRYAGEPITLAREAALLDARGVFDNRLSDDQIAACFFTMKSGLATMTALAPELELPPVFSAADIHKALIARGAYDASERSARSYVKQSPMFTPVDGGYALVARVDFVDRLQVRVDGMKQKRRFMRQAPLDAYEYVDIDDVIAEARGDRPDPQYRGPSWGDLHDGGPAFGIPKHFERGFAAWWYDRNLESGETVCRSVLYQRTGLTDYQQKTLHERMDFPDATPNEVVIAAKDDKDALSKARAMGMESVAYARQAPMRDIDGIVMRDNQGGVIYGWYVRGGNTYYKSADEDPWQVFEGIDSDDNTSPEKLAAAETKTKSKQPPKRLPPPILPKMDWYECDIYDEAYITRALYYEWLDNDLLNPADWAGKEVSIPALIAYRKRRVAAPVREIVLDYENGATVEDIPF